MSGQQAENSLHENSIGYAIILVIVAIIIFFIWYAFDTQIRDAVRWIRYGEMWIAWGIVWVIETLGFYDGNYHIPFNGQMVSWREGFAMTPQFTAEEMKYEHMAYISALAMEPLKYPIAGLLAAAAGWCLFKGPNTQYRSSLGLEGLIRRQSEIFPAIYPFIQFNPANQPPRPPGSPVPAELPPFAEALGPEEWLAYTENTAPDGKVDEKKAFNAFKKQLGPPWRGPAKLKPYKQVLLAAFCLKAARKRDLSDKMLGRLARCWTLEKGLDLSRDKKLLKEALAVLKDKKLSGDTFVKVNQHAYETTALMRALAVAREEGGVLAPAQFVWLRGFDRELWYPLNNMGRQSFHMEALGAMSHYKMEKRTSRPIPVPKVDDAVQTIVEYMGSIHKRPIPQLDYSGSKKRGVKKAI